MEEHFEPLEPRTYRTGSTKPPKKSGCLLAFILMVAIFTIGIISCLGLFNFRLLRHIEISDPNETVSIVVTGPKEDKTAGQPAVASQEPFLGISGESVSLVYQMYYHLPNGLLITAVEPGSAADAAGIKNGDVLIQVGNTPVAGPQELETALSSYVSGDTVALILYRNGKQYSVAVTLG